MRFGAGVAVLCSSILCAQSATVLQRASSASEIRGAALANSGQIFTWGDQLQRWTVPGLKASTLARGPFGEGGCLTDLDDDGAQEFVGKEGPGLGKLTWRRPPDWKPVIIDDEFEAHDCMEATLFGRKGILVIQRYMQVRFYEQGVGKRWPYREIYSIYTPSQQTGLPLSDIDGDGRVDIVCGNYWIKSPQSFKLPWHIFAINTYSETLESAMLAQAFIGKDLLVAQGHMSDARVTLFTKPQDLRQLWQATPIKGEFHRVHAIAAWNGMLFFGENNGAASRIFALKDALKDRNATGIAKGVENLQMLSTKDGMVSVGPQELVLWRYDRRR